MAQGAQGLARVQEDIHGLVNAYKALLCLELLKSVITTPALENGGKLNPAQGLPGGSGINPNPKKPVLKDDDGDTVEKSVMLDVEIVKVISERQEVTGVVLQPEVVDAQADIIGADVIEKAAGDFLAGFNKTTKLGLMHKSFPKGAFQLRQSFIAPNDMVIANKTVKKGSWIMVVKILDSELWKKVKEGKLAGFSIGGKAKVQKLSSQL